MERVSAEDLDLVRETLEGNQLSFQLLVERYQDRMFSLVRRYTRNVVEVEDIVQETFLKAYRKLYTFQHQASFSTWLYRIAVNSALDFLKRRGRNPVRAVEDPELTAEVGSTMGPGTQGARIPAPDAGMEQEELRHATHAALQELPEIFRTVLVMREYEDMAYQSMADILGISIGTVESRLFRARARFKEALLRAHPEFDPNTGGEERAVAAKKKASGGFSHGKPERKAPASTKESGRSKSNQAGPDGPAAENQQKRV